MRYCDKCGCAITSGGHKSACQGIFNTPYLCDECYEKETEAAVKGVGCFAKIFVGFLIGLGATAGISGILAKLGGCGVPDNALPKIAIGVEVLAIVCFFATKIGSKFLKSKFLRFVSNVASYISFWISLVFGTAMYFLLKYA